MKLTDDDYRKLIDLIEVGEHNYLEYEKDGETLMLEYSYEEEGYTEDDYWTGTGGFVCTGVDFKVLSVSSCNEEDDTDNNFSESEMYGMLKRYAA